MTATQAIQFASRSIESLRAERAEIEMEWRRCQRYSEVAGLNGEMARHEANEWERRLKAVTQAIWNHPEF